MLGCGYDLFPNEISVGTAVDVPASVVVVAILRRLVMAHFAEVQILVSRSSCIDPTYNSYCHRQMGRILSFTLCSFGAHGDPILMTGWCSANFTYKYFHGYVTVDTVSLINYV